MKDMLVKAGEIYIRDIKREKSRLKVGEKCYYFVLDFDAFLELEEKYGTIHAAMQALMQAAKASVIRDFLAAGLKSHNEDFSMEEILSHFDYGDIMELRTFLINELYRSLPEPEQEAGGTPLGEAKSGLTGT